MHTFQNKGAFEGWIRRIIVHTCINHLKKNKRFNESMDIVQASDSGQGRKHSINRSGQTDCGLYTSASYRLSDRFELICDRGIRAQRDRRDARYRRKYKQIAIYPGKTNAGRDFDKKNLVPGAREKTDRLTAIH